jgi:PAS domain S-box-containing protein
MSYFRQIFGIPVDPEPVMEMHLFRLLCLVAAALTLLVVVPVDHLTHFSPLVTLADLVFGVTSLLFYLASRRGRYHRKSLFFLYLLNLDLSWFATNGSQGTVSLFFFNLFIYALIFFRGKVRWLLLTVALANILGLALTEPYFSHWIAPQQNQTERLIDLILSLTMSALSCSLMIWAVLTNYDREQQRLKRLNADLERSMAERVEAEQSLRQNRELLSAVIEGTSDAIYAKDTEGRYVIFNRGAAQITGKSAAQVLGNADSLLFTGAEAEAIRELESEILSTGETRNLEQELTNGRGEKIVVQSTKGPLRGQNGAIIGVFGISRDVTENRRVEDEIRLLNEELDLRVTERTARLETAIKEQESFSYSVSHDLRAPLRHINSYSALLAEECAACLTPEALSYLERIRFASRSMGKLIDDLLELSRIGRSKLMKSRVDLGALAGAIFFRMREAEPERRVELVVAADLVAQGDPILLQQALENLLDNAWKYSRQRESARIEVGTVRLKGKEVFFVRDNGAGFDMAYRDKLFGAFQRLHGAEFEGTGIGLATVKRIVERHGGEVWAEGAVDAGATIYFTIP